MRKSLLTALASGILVLSMMGNVLATTFSYEDLYIPGTNYLMDADGSGEHLSHHWIFDITDSLNGTTADQVFNNGMITLVLEDEDSANSEKASFTFEIGPGVSEKNLNFPTWTDGFIVSSLAFSDGKVSSVLTATTGDFYFRSAQLNVTSEVYAQRDPLSPTNLTPVPEPSTVLLLGSGLFGLLYIGRKKSRKS